MAARNRMSTRPSSSTEERGRPLHQKNVVSESAGGTLVPGCTPARLGREVASVNCKAGEAFHEPSDFGFRISAISQGSWSQSAVKKPWRLPMNLAIRTGRPRGPSDLRFTIYELPME